MKPYRILLVDDEPAILRSLERVLRREKYHILTAGDAAAALAILERESVDVVISDQRMPGMCGTELLKIVKDKYPGTVRIMFSGYSDFESIVQAINEAGVFKFIPKPWDNAELEKTLDSAIEKKEVESARDILALLYRGIETIEDIAYRVAGTPMRVNVVIDFPKATGRENDILRCEELVGGVMKAIETYSQNVRSGLESVDIRIVTDGETRRAFSFSAPATE